MKIRVLICTFFLLLILFGCRESPSDHKTVLTQIGNALDMGNFNRVKLLADSVRKFCGKDLILNAKADSFLQIADRIALDFSIPEEEIIAELKEKVGDFQPGEKASWEKNNWLECRTINGEKRYFKRAVSNLNLIRHFRYEREYYDSLDSQDPEMVHRRNNILEVISASQQQFAPVVPVEMTIDYTITVNSDAVPAGETVRCWLPYPKENHSRQQNVRLLSTSQTRYIISPDSSVHRSIYIESKAKKGTPLKFSVSYSYQSSGQNFKLSGIKILPYDTTSALYMKYTSEQLPHICFNRNVKELADSIIGDEKAPNEIVRKVYMWFSKNIPWTRALEYSIMPNIPEYVLKNRRGDCGMQTFLFMSILRFKGIPVKWQSGWKVPPFGKNLHDWCEVYFEGPGWVPVDVSYGLQYSDNPQVRDFFISGIDSYRLIVNDGVSGELFPPKKFLRSEPYDFQRGEVEWRGGNLYFDKWDYEMKITYREL
ncbi:MAG: transglutaminase-like domain-containing protein [Bacteroidota bacterium]|nr:transglutaminase-like domain-containing protein [Bacteroidota bacterium]